MPLPILTTRLWAIPADQKYEELGTIIGYDKERISYLRRLGDSFMSFFGGSDGLIRKKVDNCIDRAKADMRAKAIKEFGSDVTHIYQADFTMSSYAEYRDYLECRIEGIAIKKLPSSGSNSKNSSKNSSKNDTKKNNTLKRFLNTTTRRSSRR